MIISSWRDSFSDKNLANPDEAQLAQIIKSYENHIRFAALLGCGMVGTETGAVNTEYRYTPENHTKRALGIFIENLKKVVDYAERMGVCFGIEPVYKHIHRDLQDFYSSQAPQPPHDFAKTLFSYKAPYRKSSPHCLH